MEFVEYKEILKSVPLLRFLHETTLERLAEESREVSLKAGEILFREGDPGLTMYIVLKGQLAILKEGIEITIMGPQSFFGEMALIGGQPRAVTAQAQEPSVLVEINEAQFNGYFAAHPKVMMAIMKTMSARYRRISVPALASPDTLHPDEEHPVDSFKVMDLSTGELLLFRAEDFKITQASSLACHETGFNEEEFRGMKFLDLAMKMDPTDLKTLVASLVNKSQPSAVLESPIRRKDGSIYPAEIRFQVVPNAGKAPQILAWLRDMTEHKYMEEAIHQMAYYDSVTGLPNRNLLADRLAVVLTQSRRNRDHVAIIFMDLDHFKIINDTLGHSCGDELLKEVAQRLKTLLRKEDTVARLGGDEFVIVAPAIGQAGSAALLAEKILQQFDEPIVVEGNELYVGASLGVSIFPEDGDKESVLLKNADLALYRAKELGRNNFQLYTPAMNRKVMERVAIQKNLRKAIELDEFELVFQPRVELVSGAIVGVEALVRWNNPELGHMMPSEFIPVAEDTRLIIELGTWTLLQACRDLKIWQDAGLSLSVAVNLSTLQFTHPSLVNEVQSVLEETGVAPDAVELEITETILMKDTDLAIGVLKNLCAKGIRVAIDDFGTGYSSLNYLKNLPIHFLKIDQTFIRDFSQPTNRAIIKTIVSLAHSLGLRTVAEGVETEDQKKFLQSIDCNEAQGYLFSPPLSARGVEELLLSEKKNA